MAHFAQLDENNVVTQVIVVANNELIDDLGVEQESKGADFCSVLFGGRWIQTSYNGSTRKNFASVGGTYDPIADVFYDLQPFNSWILNQETYKWEAPIAYPNDEKSYTWNEERLSWIEIKAL